MNFFPFSHLRNLNPRPKFLSGNDRKSHADLLIDKSEKIFECPWNPMFLAVRASHPVRGFLYFDRSVDSYMLTGPWSPTFLSGPLIPLLWPVHGFLYFSRSRDPYILTGAKLYHIKNYGLSRGASFFRGDSDLRTVHCTNSPSVNSLKYWSAKLYLWKKSLSWFVQVGRKDDDSDDEFLAISHNSISSHSRKYRNPGNITWFGHMHWICGLPMWKIIWLLDALWRPLFFSDQIVLISTWN